MNPVLVLTHNGREMNKRCIVSALNQDVSTWVHAVDNDSSDGTWEYLKDNTTGPVQFSPQIGVSAGWNVGLKFLFECEDVDHVLVINSDVILPRWFYSSLLSYEGPFISGVSVGTMEQIANPEPRKELIAHPDFSAWLIRRECWEKVGPFDETMKLYASDLDYHIRAHRAGVRLMNSGVAFYHERSSTLNNASPRERREIQMQADADRMRLREKWNCNAWDASYEAMFDEKFFGIDAKK